MRIKCSESGQLRCNSFLRQTRLQLPVEQFRMESESSKEILLLRKHLQRYIQILNKCYKQLQEMEKTAEPHLKSVMNLSEQLVCCKAVQERNLPKQIDFAEVKHRLLFKISREINEEIDKLHAEIAKLEDESYQLSKQYEQCMTQSKKCCKEGLLDVILEKTPLYPSFADMLEMVDTSERIVREQCQCKKYLLESFSPYQTDVSTTWEKSWKSGDTELNGILQGYLALTTYFMELQT